jgi:ribosome-binding factor A
MGLRHQKVVAALKREISNIIHDELKDSRLGFVTVMRVDLTPDLRYAKIYFSVLGQEKQQKKTQEALQSAKPFIRRLVGQRVKLRFVPEITFKLDRSTEYSIKIEQALDRIKEQKK